MMTDGNTKPWVTVKTFSQGGAAAEVSQATGTDKYSYRLSWTDGKRLGPWFPCIEGASFQADVAAVAKLAESFIVERKAAHLQEREDRLAKRRGKLSQTRGR